MTEVSMNPPHEEVSVERSQPNQHWLFMPVFTLCFLLTLMVSGFSSVTIKQLLLPIQIGQLDPVHTNTSFTLVASSGAFIGLLASLVMAALSDRLILPWGRRRPWIMGGIIVAGVGMTIMGLATSVLMVLLGDTLAQVGVDTLLATTTAILPDQVPKQRRFFLSACAGMAPNVGGVVGLLLVTHFTNPRIVAQGYVLIAGLCVLCVVLFLLIYREFPSGHEALPPFHLGGFLNSFLHPLRSSDFTYTLVSRCCIYLSFTMVTAYLLFSVRAVFHLAVPAASATLTTFQVLSTLLLCVVAIVTGCFSQRANRLKPFVISGAFVMAIGLVMIAFAPSLLLLYAAGVLLGAGFGLYLGVDINLVVRVLPSESARGKDLAIMYTAIFLPVILSTLIGGPILNVSHNNFTWLFLIAACSSVLAGLCIAPIRSVQ